MIIGQMLKSRNRVSGLFASRLHACLQKWVGSDVWNLSSIAFSYWLDEKERRFGLSVSWHFDCFLAHNISSVHSCLL